MSRFRRAVAGLAVLGAALTGELAFHHYEVEAAHERVADCFVRLDGDEAKGCATAAEFSSLGLGLAETATAVGGIACGVQMYRAIRDDERPELAIQQMDRSSL